jgi:hypothetical protein
MEAIVAVAVSLENRQRRYFLTWGRIQDVVDGAPLEAIVLKHASKFALGGTARSARVCLTLREAARQPYFYECFFEMAQRRIPSGKGFAAWKRAVDRRMRRGMELYFLGKPGR